jgi:hypothetical protein
MIDGMPEQLMQTFTVDFSPEQVAGEIMKALAGSAEGHLLGMKAKALGLAARLLPARLARRVVKYVTGY